MVEVLAACSGGDAEEVERQITIPLEVTLAGMPRLQTLASEFGCRPQSAFRPGSSRAPITTPRGEKSSTACKSSNRWPGISPSIVPLAGRREIALHPGWSPRCRGPAGLHHERPADPAEMALGRRVPPVARRSRRRQPRRHDQTLRNPCLSRTASAAMGSRCGSSWTPSPGATPMLPLGIWSRGKSRSMFARLASSAAGWIPSRPKRDRRRPGEGRQAAPGRRAAASARDARSWSGA